MVSVQFQRLHPEAKLPFYATKQAAGMDISACLESDITILPQGSALIPTGFAIALPEGYEAQLRPRSGLALKNLISLPNSPATIDADYRGEVKVILINHGREPFTVRNGDRIAQMIIAKVEQAHFEVVSELGSTERGVGGFGHTGIERK